MSSNSASPDTSPTKNLIAFTTRWGTKFGGINSFNQDLLSAFSAVFHQHVTTTCIVLDASQSEFDDASNEQVKLISLELPEQKDFHPDLENTVWQKLCDSNINIDPHSTIWIGHDRITGEIALAAAKTRGGKSTLIHHMSYSHYESFAENSLAAKAKEDKQRTIFLEADIAIGIGPLLGAALEDMREGKATHTLLPGLPDIIAKDNPRNFKGFLSGRLSEDARRIKQAHLGVAAFADAIRQSDENPGLPDALRGENEPKLTLRGVDLENCENQLTSEAELELKLFSEEYAGRAFNLQALPFTTDRKAVFDDLRNASVAMMPSWHEGFGLVAWEAIAAGVPLIISNKSGAFRFLKNFEDGIYTNCIYAIDIAGTSSAPFFLPKDIAKLSSALINIAKEPHIARQKAARLREVLISKYTWANCAREIAEIFNWKIDNEFHTKVIQEPQQPELPNAPHSIDFIELPTPRWQSQAGLSDSQLLRAEEAIIPFDSKRTTFMSNQTDWANASEYPISIRLLTGAGGVGKTRLALEMCKNLNKQGWIAGFLTGDFEPEQSKTLATQISNSKRPCCIVIDYAETRQTTLLSILRNLIRENPINPVRLMLLARDGGEWWRALPAKDSLCEGLLDGSATSGPLALPHLHSTEIERRDAYQLALSTFSNLLDVVPAQHCPDLTETYFSRPLYIQMAALMALRGERPRSAEALQRALISHEKRYWGKILSENAANNKENERQAAILMTLATLANGLPTDRSVENTWILAGEQHKSLKVLFTALMPLYPDRQGLQGLRPDLVGEALVAQSLLSSTGPSILNAVLTSGKRLRQTSLTIIARALRDREDLASLVEDALAKNFVACIEELIEVCIETPSPLPLIIERAYSRLPNNIQLQAAGILGNVFEFEILPLTGLDVLACRTTMSQRAKQKLKKNNEVNTLNYAYAVRNISVALFQNGNHEESLFNAKKAVELYQQLTDINPRKYEAGLASCLTNYASRLGDNGQASEGLAAAQAAVTIYRNLDKLHPGKYISEVAMTLNNYGSCLDDEGRSDEAVFAAKECLEIYSTLAQAKPEEFTPDVAMALNNYANYLDSEGKSSEALTLGKEAMRIYQKLALHSPERFTARLAMSCNNYAAFLSNMEETQKESLPMYLKALDIYEELAIAKPERFQSDLAMSLSNYGGCLAAQGKIKEALTNSSKSLEIYKTLATKNTDQYKSDHALALKQHAHLLADHGQFDAAVTTAVQAAALLEDLAFQNPGYHLLAKDHCRLDLCLWSWLASKNCQLHAISQPLPIITSPRKLRDVNFHKIWLQACFLQNIQVLRQAFSEFHLLDHAQQREYKGAIFLLVALAQKEQDTNLIPDYCKELSDSYLRQRGGVLPSWMIEMAISHDIKLL